MVAATASVGFSYSCTTSPQESWGYVCHFPYCLPLITRTSFAHITIPYLTIWRHIIIQCPQRGSPSALKTDGGGRGSASPSGLFRNLPGNPAQSTIALPSPMKRASSLAGKCFIIARENTPINKQSRPWLGLITASHISSDPRKSNTMETESWVCYWVSLTGLFLHMK